MVFKDWLNLILGPLLVDRGITQHYRVDTFRTLAQSLVCERPNHDFPMSESPQSRLS